MNTATKTPAQQITDLTPAATAPAWRRARALRAAEAIMRSTEQALRDAQTDCTRIHYGMDCASFGPARKERLKERQAQLDAAQAAFTRAFGRK